MYRRQTVRKARLANPLTFVSGVMSSEDPISQGEVRDLPERGYPCRDCLNKDKNTSLIQSAIRSAHICVWTTQKTESQRDLWFFHCYRSIFSIFKVSSICSWMEAGAPELTSAGPLNNLSIMSLKISLHFDTEAERMWLLKKWINDNDYCH